MQLTIAGQSLGAETFVISSGPSGVSIAVTKLTLALGGFINITAANNLNGALLVTHGRRRRVVLDQRRRRACSRCPAG